MSEQKIEVGMNEQARLVTAVLAASSWPEREQAQTTHAVHPHSKQTKQYLVDYKGLTAVGELNAALEAEISLVDIFTAAVRCSWPDLTPQEEIPAGLESWAGALADFSRATAIDTFWSTHSADWDEALDGLNGILKDKDIAGFIEKLTGKPLPKPVVVMPTITYPLLNPVIAETADEIIFILPPAKAWGESPPWPHGEDPGWVVIQTCWYLCEFFMLDVLADLDDTQKALLLHSAVTLCLESELEEEMMAYLVRAKKEHSLPQLPLTVENLRDYLANPEGKELTSVVKD